MVGRKGKAAEQKRKLLHVLQECEDSGIDADMEKLCRVLYRDFAAMSTPVDFAEEKIALLEDALFAIKNRKQYMAQVCLRRVEELNQYAGKRTGDKNCMRLLGKVKSKLPWSKDRSQEAMFQKEEEETEQKIFELQKKIALLYDNYSAIEKQIGDKAKKCSLLPQDSSEYMQIRQQALTLIPRLRALGQQLRLHAKMLDSSSRYHAMIQTGKTTFELKAFLPDINKAEAMMEWIAEETQTLSESMSDLEEGIGKYEKSMQESSGIDAFTDGKEFDERIQMQKETEKTPAHDHSGIETVDADEKGELA